MVNIDGQMGRTTGENWWGCTAYLTPSSVLPVASGQKLMLETESIGARKIAGHLINLFSLASGQLRNAKNCAIYAKNHAFVYNSSMDATIAIEIYSDYSGCSDVNELLKRCFFLSCCLLVFKLVQSGKRRQRWQRRKHCETGKIWLHFSPKTAVNAKDCSVAPC